MDTSTVVSALIGGWFRLVADAVERGDLELVCSEELLAELSDVLSRPRLAVAVSPDSAALMVFLYSQRAIFVEPKMIEPICRDSSDDYLLGLSDAAGADLLVTRDEDLLSLGLYKKTQIVYPAKFLQMLSTK